MMRQVLSGIVVAAVASFVTLQIARPSGELDPAQLDRLANRLADHAALRSAFAPKALGYTEESEEDAWLAGTAQDGSPRPGPADDEKQLADAAKAACYLTKVEFQGMNDLNDQTACRIAIDEFTGWWTLHAVQGDGTDASVRCNARCVEWK
jgi:hypothetical protein